MQPTALGKSGATYIFMTNTLRKAVKLVPLNTPFQACAGILMCYKHYLVSTAVSGVTEPRLDVTLNVGLLD